MSIVISKLAYPFFDSVKQPSPSIKPANHSLKFENFAKLLFKDEVIQIEQDKWFRDYCNANISISKVAYTIKQTQNKRELIYDGDICVDTKPLVFEKQSFKDLISKDFL